MLSSITLPDRHSFDMLEKVRNAPINASQTLASKSNNNSMQAQSTPSPVDALITADASAKARYITELQAYLEDFGNQHYPKEFMQNRVQGQLKLMISIAPTGDVKTTTLLQSSGNAQLDALTISLVQRAAPFKAFPQEMAAQQSSLEFVRTWDFKS